SQPQPLASDVDRSRPSVTPALNVARIGPNLTIKGSVTGEEDLQIDGKVEGPVTIRGRLTVGCSGQLSAGVTARELAVYGKVSGNADARDRGDLKGGRGDRRHPDRPPQHLGLRYLHACHRNSPCA